MAFVNGFYFTKAEDRRTEEFLETQGLEDRQIKAVKIYMQSQITGSILLWTSSLSPLCFILGAVAAIYFDLG